MRLPGRRVSGGKGMNAYNLQLTTTRAQEVHIRFYKTSLRSLVNFLVLIQNYFENMRHDRRNNETIRKNLPS